MSVLYYRVARVVWTRQRKLSVHSSMTINDSSSKIMNSSRRRVTRMLLIVVVVFFLCWMPFVVYSGFLEERLKGFPNPMDAVRLGLYGLGLFNSICNPFIYYFNGGNLNPRVLIENERRRRSSSATSTLYLRNSLKSKRRSPTPPSGNCPNDKEDARKPSLGPKRNPSSSTNSCPSTTPKEEESVFVFSADASANTETDL
ncbi:hypothetical protein QZH41_000141 [Actinostola sp. cb2023]|nr:hypothetical protein QZH41_000141 [Actinostola sp. cb2023]